MHAKPISPNSTYRRVVLYYFRVPNVNVSIEERLKNVTHWGGEGGIQMGHGRLVVRHLPQSDRRPHFPHSASVPYDYDPPPSAHGAGRARHDAVSGWAMRQHHGRARTQERASRARARARRRRLRTRVDPLQIRAGDPSLSS